MTTIWSIRWPAGMRPASRGRAGGTGRPRPTPTTRRPGSWRPSTKPSAIAIRRKTTVVAAPSGVVEVRPGVANIVPVRATLLQDLRDSDPALLERLASRTLQAARRVARQRGLVLEVEHLLRADPVRMSPRIQATIETTAGAARLAKGSGLAAATGPSGRRDVLGRFAPAVADAEPYELVDAEDLAVAEDPEPEDPELPDEPEPGPIDPDESAEDEDDEAAPASSALPVPRTGIAKVQALLQEALRLGQEYNLIERQPDGSLLLAGQTPTRGRDTSDCACAQCMPWAQQHWWCVMCGSGPHDWHLLKPQFERQTLKPGGIEGARQAACSAQCARDFLSRLGRQPSGLPTSRQLDPTLGLPG